MRFDEKAPPAAFAGRSSINQQRPKTQLKTPYDFVVFGAGFSGSVISRSFAGGSLRIPTPVSHRLKLTSLKDQGATRSIVARPSGKTALLGDSHVCSPSVRGPWWPN